MKQFNKSYSSKPLVLSVTSLKLTQYCWTVVDWWRWWSSPVGAVFVDLLLTPSVFSVSTGHPARQNMTVSASSLAAAIDGCGGRQCIAAGTQVSSPSPDRSSIFPWNSSDDSSKIASKLRMLHEPFLRAWVGTDVDYDLNSLCQSL
ncbi:hypothetical protein Vadar_030271 [Vaccinium darrowii]|uniref:Uncharacterized protein n=1 Tax=Vaccinium darrowii TaxID=229202 RepID=A0ACB7ZFH0_9ERIC|nr:hypothetical protein Vadar_030271 [Vaccinium darrowii]